MTPKWWAAALFASVALNALFVGIFVTQYLQRDREIAERMTAYTVPWALRVIGEEVGPAARRNYVRHQATMADDRRRLRDDYAEINELLAAPRYDRAALLAALSKLRRDVGLAQATMHESMADFATELSPEHRRKLVDFVKEWANKREQRATRRDEKIEEKDRRENRGN